WPVAPGALLPTHTGLGPVCREHAEVLQALRTDRHPPRPLFDGCSTVRGDPQRVGAYRLPSLRSPRPGGLPDLHDGVDGPRPRVQRAGRGATGVARKAAGALPDRAA